jgi:hypothetical protein
MAVKINSGDLTHKVVFKQPVSSLNNRGGRVFSYGLQETGGGDPVNVWIMTWAAVRAFNEHRVSEVNAVALIGSLDFYIRWSAEREAIDKDWLLVYKGEDYTIHQIELIEQKTRFIRFTAKVKSNG